MSKKIESRRDIPDAPAYVLANDTFMSGWGYAKDKISTGIWPCQTNGEAQFISAMISTRSDMARMRIAFQKPRMRSNVQYFLCDYEESRRYYTLWMIITYYPRESVWRIRWAEPVQNKAARDMGLNAWGNYPRAVSFKEAVFECIRAAKNVGARHLSIDYGISTLPDE